MHDPNIFSAPRAVADPDSAPDEPLLPLSGTAQRRLFREVRNLQAIERFLALVFGAIGGGWLWDQIGAARQVITFWEGVALSALGFAVVSTAVGLTNFGVSLLASPVSGPRPARALGQALQEAVGRLVLGILGGGLLGALFGAIAWPVTSLFTGAGAVTFTFPGWLYGAYAARRILTRFQFAGLEDPGNLW
jgi:hypothetical protein